MCNSKPHKCPVCNGNGLVPPRFYNQVSGQWSTINTAPETCRTCNGRGIVWQDNIANEFRHPICSFNIDYTSVI